MFGIFVSNGCWECQLDLGPAVQLAPYFEPASNRSGALTDSWQSPVSFPATLREEVRVHANPVVAYSQSQHSVAVTDVQFYMARPRVMKCIGQRFSPNAVKVHPKADLKISRRAFQPPVRYRASAVFRQALIHSQLPADGGKTFDDVHAIEASASQLLNSIPSPDHPVWESAAVSSFSLFR